jgi:hypothetical protein
MKPSDFFTRDRANKGEKLPLSLPDGSPTDEYLNVRGVDSDQFREAVNEYRRELIGYAAIKDESERARKSEQARIKLMCALVIGWSFEAELTQEALAELFSEAPHIADEADKFASDRRRFFRKRSTSSPKD